MGSRPGKDRCESTSTHDVVSEERHSEPERQHEQVRPETRKQTGKTCGLRAEVPKTTRHQHTWKGDRQVKQTTPVTGKQTGTTTLITGNRQVTTPATGKQTGVSYHVDGSQRYNFWLDPDQQF